MKILIFSHESLFPIFGGHREYLNEFLNALVTDGHECTMISWGPENDYSINQNRLKIVHFNTDSSAKKSAFKPRQVNYSSSLSYLASRLGASQYLALKYNSPDMKIWNILEKLNGFDLILKSGPNASRLPLTLSLRSGTPFIERLDWFGLPRTLANRGEWLAYLGEKIFFDKIVEKGIVSLFDHTIKKKELSLVGSRNVYVASRADYEEIKLLNQDLNMDYIFPFLSDIEDNREVDENDSEKFCLYFASKTFSSLISVKFLDKIAKQNDGLKIKITGDFEDHKAMYNRPNLQILGKLSDVEFTDYLKKARFVVFPTIEGHGVQMRLIRALSFGKAIIATSAICSSFTGLIDGKHIIIRDTPQEFESAMREMNADESLRNALSRNAKRYFLTELNRENSMRRFYGMVERAKQQTLAYC